MAAVASALVVMLCLRDRSFRVEVYDGVHVGKIILAYSIGGVGGGGIAGALRPLTRWPLGGMVVGAMAAIFVYFTLGVALGQASLEVLPGAVFAGVLVGGMLGWELSSTGPADRHSIVVRKDEAPRLRWVQIGGVSAMALGGVTCTAFAESDTVVSRSFLLFGVGLVLVVATQIYIWAVRSLRKFGRDLKR